MAHKTMEKTAGAPDASAQAKPLASTPNRMNGLDPSAPHSSLTNGSLKNSSELPSFAHQLKENTDSLSWKIPPTREQKYLKNGKPDRRGRKHKVQRDDADAAKNTGMKNDLANRTDIVINKKTTKQDDLKDSDFAEDEIDKMTTRLFHCVPRLLNNDAQRYLLGPLIDKIIKIYGGRLESDGKTPAVLRPLSVARKVQANTRLMRHWPDIRQGMDMTESEWARLGVEHFNRVAAALGYELMEHYGMNPEQLEGLLGPRAATIVKMLNATPGQHHAWDERRYETYLKTLQADDGAWALSALITIERLNHVSTLPKEQLEILIKQTRVHLRLLSELEKIERRNRIARKWPHEGSQEMKYHLMMEKILEVNEIYKLGIKIKDSPIRDKIPQETHKKQSDNQKEEPG